MGEGYIVLGTVNYVPQHRGLEEEIVHVQRETYEEMLLAMHFEKLRPNATTLYVGPEELHVATRGKTIGSVTYDAKDQDSSPGGANRRVPLITVLPTREKSLWALADDFRNFLHTRVTVIPRPLLNLNDYVNTLEGLLPSLVEAKGDMRKTEYYNRELKVACERFLSQLDVAQEQPKNRNARIQLANERRYLRTYFPSDHTLNRLLDVCVSDLLYDEARRTIDILLFPIEGKD